MPGQLNVGRVRTAIAHQLETKLGTEVQVATAPDQLSPPCLLISMPTIEYNTAFARGLDYAEFPIYLILPRTHDQAAVDIADELISGTGPRSVVEILQADQAFGGASATSVVKRADAEIYPGTDLPAYRWTVEVYG